MTDEEKKDDAQAPLVVVTGSRGAYQIVIALVPEETGAHRMSGNLAALAEEFARQGAHVEALEERPPAVKLAPVLRFGPATEILECH